MLFDRQATIEIFRHAILDTLDQTVRELFSETQGATDADLPNLFRAIDSQVETLAKRYGIIWE